MPSLPVCRRHGIQRWPRRQLQKVNRALDELEARQMLQTQQQALAGAPPPHAAGLEACEWGVALASRLLLWHWCKGTSCSPPCDLQP